MNEHGEGGNTRQIVQYILFHHYRQVAILMREVTRFQEQHGLQSWSCVIGGGRSSTRNALRTYQFYLIYQTLTSRPMTRPMRSSSATR